MMNFSQPQPGAGTSQPAPPQQGPSTGGVWAPLAWITQAEYAALEAIPGYGRLVKGSAAAGAAAGSAIGAASGGANPLQVAGNKITDPSFWKGLGLVLAAGVVGLMGLWLWLGGSQTHVTVQTAEKAAAA
jgi:hypothetical protein